MSAEIERFFLHSEIKMQLYKRSAGKWSPVVFVEGNREKLENEENVCYFQIRCCCLCSGFSTWKSANSVYLFPIFQAPTHTATHHSLSTTLKLKWKTTSRRESYWKNFPFIFNAKFSLSLYTTPVTNTCAKQ